VGEEVGVARVEWVKQRLENWALWKARECGGGLGFSTTTSFLHDADTSRYRESTIPVDEVEASVTNEAVESLKLGRGHLYETLSHVYVDGIGIKETARRMRRAESTIYAHLEQAENCLAQWFRERSERQAAAREQIRKSAGL
jgi:hypothetical protein